MVWKQCEDCDHIFTSGYFTPTVEADLFKKIQADQVAGYDMERNRGPASKIVDRVMPFVTEGVWLDVGFGNGALLFAAQEYGFHPVGLDTRAENVQLLRTYGIPAYAQSVAQVQMTEACSVVSMMDVLEHMPYPGDGLRGAHALLKSNGILLVSMPNTECAVWRLWDEQNGNPYWGELEHYHNFSRTRLYSLLREYGFKPLQYKISERYRACMEVIAVKAPPQNERKDP
jgi:SAM-dependent methyltransferase